MKDKTLKREYAFALFCMIAWSWWKGDVPMLEVILLPSLGYIAAVSGAHMYFKKTEVE